jgi:hypothetical protein
MISTPQPSHSVTGLHGLLLAWRWRTVVHCRQVRAGEVFDDTPPLSRAPSGQKKIAYPETGSGEERAKAAKGPVGHSNRRGPEARRCNRDLDRGRQPIACPTRGCATTRTGAVGCGIDGTQSPSWTLIGSDEALTFLRGLGRARLDLALGVLAEPPRNAKKSGVMISTSDSLKTSMMLRWSSA